jgi:hypothetical protein
MPSVSLGNFHRKTILRGHLPVGGRDFFVLAKVECAETALNPMLQRRQIS